MARREHSLHERIQALSYMASSGKSSTEVAKDMGLNAWTLRSWWTNRDRIYAQADAEGMSYSRPPGEESSEAQREALHATQQTRVDVLEKIEQTVDELLDRVGEKVDDANLDAVVSAISTLLSRIEAMTYRPGVEAREDRRAQAEEAALKAARDPDRVEQALVQALRRRGSIEQEHSDGSLSDDDDSSTPPS